jgi:hypothetical protein
MEDHHQPLEGSARHLGMLWRTHSKHDLESCGKIASLLGSYFSKETERLPTSRLASRSIDRPSFSSFLRLAADVCVVHDACPYAASSVFANDRALADLVARLLAASLIEETSQVQFQEPLSDALAALIQFMNHREDSDPSNESHRYFDLFLDLLMLCASLMQIRFRSLSGTVILRENSSIRGMKSLGRILLRRSHMDLKESKNLILLTQGGLCSFPLTRFCDIIGGEKTLLAVVKTLLKQKSRESTEFSEMNRPGSDFLARLITPQALELVRNCAELATINISNCFLVLKGRERDILDLIHPDRSSEPINLGEDVLRISCEAATEWLDIFLTLLPTRQSLVETKSLVLAVLETLKVATDINNNITLLPRYKVLCANLLNTVFAFSIQNRSETVSNEETDVSDDDNDDDNDDDVTRVVNFTQNSFLLSILPTAFRTAERVLVRGLLTDITSSVDIASSQAIRHFFINLIAASFETSPSLASPFLSLLFIRLGNLEDYNLVFMHLEKILISSHFAFVRGLALVFEPSVLTEESSNFPLIRLCDSDTEVFHLTRNILTAVIGDSENLSMEVISENWKIYSLTLSSEAPIYMEVKAQSELYSSIIDSNDSLRQSACCHLGLLTLGPERFREYIASATSTRIIHNLNKELYFGKILDSFIEQRLIHHLGAVGSRSIAVVEEVFEAETTSPLDFAKLSQCRQLAICLLLHMPIVKLERLDSVVSKLITNKEVSSRLASVAECSARLLPQSLNRLTSDSLSLPSLGDLLTEAALADKLATGKRASSDIRKLALRLVVRGTNPESTGSSERAESLLDTVFRACADESALTDSSCEDLLMRTLSSLFSSSIDRVLRSATSLINSSAETSIKFSSGGGFIGARVQGAPGQYRPVVPQLVSVLGRTLTATTRCFTVLLEGISLKRRPAVLAQMTCNLEFYANVAMLAVLIFWLHERSLSFVLYAATSSPIVSTANPQRKQAPQQNTIDKYAMIEGKKRALDSAAAAKAMSEMLLPLLTSESLSAILRGNTSSLKLSATVTSSMIEAANEAFQSNGKMTMPPVISRLLNLLQQAKHDERFQSTTMSASSTALPHPLSSNDNKTSTSNELHGRISCSICSENPSTIWSGSQDTSSLHAVLCALDPSSVVRAAVGMTSLTPQSTTRCLRVGQPLHWKALFVIAQACLCLSSANISETTSRLSALSAVTHHAAVAGIPLVSDPSSIRIGSNDDSVVRSILVDTFSAIVTPQGPSSTLWEAAIRSLLGITRYLSRMRPFQATGRGVIVKEDTAVYQALLNVVSHRINLASSEHAGQEYFVRMSLEQDTWNLGSTSSPLWSVNSIKRNYSPYSDVSIEILDALRILHWLAVSTDGKAFDEIEGSSSKLSNERSSILAHAMYAVAKELDNCAHQRLGEPFDALSWSRIGSSLSDNDDNDDNYHGDLSMNMLSFLSATSGDGNTITRTSRIGQVHLQEQTLALRDSALNGPLPTHGLIVSGDEVLYDILQPSYLVAERLGSSRQAFLSTCILSLISVWMHCSVREQLLLHKRIDDEISDVSAKDESSLLLSHIISEKNEVSRHIQKIAAHYGLSIFGLIWSLADEILPRVSFSLLHPEPIKLLTKASCGIFSFQGTQAIEPLLIPFLFDLCDGECGVFEFLNLSLPYILPALFVTDGGIKYQPQLHLLAWYLFKAKTVDVKPPVSVSVPPPAVQRVVGTKRKIEDADASDVNPKKQKDLLRFFISTSTSSDVPAATVMKIRAEFSLSRCGIAAFQVDTDEIRKKDMIQSMMYKSAHLFFVRMLLTPSRPEFAHAITQNLKNLPEKWHGVDFKEKLADHVFDNALISLVWHLGDDPTDSPLNRAALALRQFAFFARNSHRFELPKLFKPDPIKRAVKQLADAFQTTKCDDNLGSTINVFPYFLSSASTSPLPKSGFSTKGAPTIFDVDKKKCDEEIEFLTSLSVASRYLLDLRIRFESKEGIIDDNLREELGRARENACSLISPMEHLFQRYFLMLTSKLSHVLKKSEDISTKLRTLIVLQRILVRVCGDQKLDKHIPAILALLKLALGEPALRLAACSIWVTFVSLLSPSALRSYLPVFALGLIPYMEEENSRSIDKKNGIHGLHKKTLVKAALDTLSHVSSSSNVLAAKSDIDSERSNVESLIDASERYDAALREDMLSVKPHLFPEPGAFFELHISTPTALRLDQFGVPILPVSQERRGGTSSTNADIGTNQFLNIRSCRDAVLCTLRFLLVENHAVLRSSFSDIPSLQGVDGLEDFEAILKAELTERHEISLEQRLPKLVGLLRKDTDEVQEMALKELLRHLSSTDGSRLLHHFILDAMPDGAAPIVNELISGLLDLTRRGTSSRVRQLCASCLGQLGAIDPSRLTVLSQHDFRPELGDRRLMVSTINFLVKALRAASDKLHHDRFAFAIQELVKQYGIFIDVIRTGGIAVPPTTQSLKTVLQTPLKALVPIKKPEPIVIDLDADDTTDFGAGSGTAVSYNAEADSTGAVKLPSKLQESFTYDWRGIYSSEPAGVISFSDLDDAASLAEKEEVSSLVEVITPFWSSSFRYPYKEFPLLTPYVSYFSKLVQGGFSEKDRLFEQWLQNWMKYLLEQVRLIIPPRREAWEAISAIVGLHEPTMLHVLPYIVRDALVSGSTALRDSVRIEIIDILRDSDSSFPEGSPRMSSTGSSSLPDASKASKGGSRSSSSLRHRITHAIFSLLDTLKRWYTSAIERKPDAERPQGIVNWGKLSFPPSNAGQGSNVAQGNSSTANQHHKILKSELLDHIPLRMLARAAYRVNAFTRALSYLETDLRSDISRNNFGSARVVNAISGEINDGAIGGILLGPVPYSREDLAYMQLIYSKIDEPDGMAGIAMLRSQLLASSTPMFVPETRERRASVSELQRSEQIRESNALLSERMMDCEHEARWTDALMCYEQALQQIPNHESAPKNGEEERNSISIDTSMDESSSSRVSQLILSEPDLHGGLLRCLKNIGHMQTALNHAVGILSRRPDLSNVVTPHAIEASWRLGQWGQLDKLLSHNEICESSEGSTSEESTNFDTALGGALLHLQRSHETAMALAVMPADERIKLRRQFDNIGVQSELITTYGDQGRRLRFSSPLSLSEERRNSINPAVLHLLSSICKGTVLGSARYSAMSAGFKRLRASAPTAISLPVLTEHIPVSLHSSKVLQSLLSAIPTFVNTCTSSSMLLLGNLSNKPTLNSPHYYDNYDLDRIKDDENVARFHSAIEAARLDVLSGLSAASMESYSRAYPFMIRLHQLREIEMASELVRRPLRDQSEATHEIIRNWDLEARLRITAPSLVLQEPILALRRTLFSMLGLRDLEARGWLELARAARASGHPSTASFALLHAAQLGEDVASLQSAKMLYAQGHVHRALTELEPVEPDFHKVVNDLLKACEVDREIPSAPSRIAHRRAALRAKKLEAKKILYATNWIVDARYAVEDTIRSRYQMVIKLESEWEKPYFFLGRYCDILLKQMLENPPQKHSLESQSGQYESGQYRKMKPLIDGWILRRDQLIYDLINNFSRSLKFGHSQIFQSLPRMFTLFLDYGAACCAARETILAYKSSFRDDKSEMQILYESKDPDQCVRTRLFYPTPYVLKTLHGAIDRFIDSSGTGPRLYTGLSQLCSRICHREDICWMFIRKALIKTLILYPQQALWLFMGLEMSQISLNQLRKSRAYGCVIDLHRHLKEINNADTVELVPLMRQLFKELVEVARKEVPKEEKSFIVNIIEKDRFNAARVPVPLLSSLSVILPATEKNNGGIGGSIGGYSSHGSATSNLGGLPRDCPMIAKFDKTAELMHSKERPRKLTVLATDGKRYNFLCKREKVGDLRKDARMMEFASVVNRLLAKDPEGSRRKLRMRTYAVMILNEESALMQWVEMTSGLRREIDWCYHLCGQLESQKKLMAKEKYLKLHFEDIQAQFGVLEFAQQQQLQQQQQPQQQQHQQQLQQQQQQQITYTPGDLVRRYRAEILSQFPPVFHKWFAHKFPDPTAWMEARTAFGRSAAVWSMVGHVIGLGDRHGDNVLLDNASGECVHVDFDVLFDKGMVLTRPEIVPFRLTPNMLDAMGLAGYEGIFRRVSESTMQTLRSQKDVLISVLDPLIHDPLVEWNKTKKSQAVAETAGSRQQQVAVRSIAGEIPSTAQGGESESTDAVFMVQKIDERLNGIYNAGTEQQRRNNRNLSAGSRGSLSAAPNSALEVRGQVHRLLKEATDDHNLARMYIGWMPFL